MAVLYQALATFGADLVVVSAIAIAFGLSFCVGGSTAGTSRIDRWFDAVAHIGLAISMVAFALLAPLAFSIFEWAGLDVLQHSGLRLLVSILGVGIVVTIPAAATGRLTQSYLLCAKRPQASVVAFLLGIASGSVICVVWASMLERVDLVAWLLAAGQVAISLWIVTRTLSTNQLDDLPRTTNALLSVLCACTAVAVGLLLAVLWRVLQQLMPTTTGLVFVAISFIAAGAGLLLAVLGRTRESARVRLASVTCCLAGAWTIGLVASFDILVRLCLTANAHLSDTWLLISARTGITALILLPCGLACGAILAGFGNSRSNSPAGESPHMVLVAILTGLIGGRWLIASGWSIPDLLASGSACLTLVGIAGVFWRENAVRSDVPSNRNAEGDSRRLVVFAWLRSRWFPRCLATAALGFAVASPWILAGYSPDTASRRLFSTQMFAAFRNGTEFADLDGLDDARLLETRECRSGTLTVWATSGFHRQLRQDGIPLSAVSTDTRICPHYPAELLATMIPMVLHESPRNVLLMGTAGGVTVKTVLEFPVHSLRWSDADAERVALIRESLWGQANFEPSAVPPVAAHAQVAPSTSVVSKTADRPHVAGRPFNDDRLQFVQMPSELMVAVDSGLYDVALSFPESAALLSGTGQYTREFYLNAARRLANDGLFGQRFQTADFGPQPTREVLHTLNQAFEYVAAIECAPGEFVIVGSNSPKGLKRLGLMDRLQLPHVATVLQEAGWDWSVALKLNTIYGAAATEYLAKTQPTANTTANGRFAFSLPPEVMRWGVKNLELRTEIGPYTHVLLTWFHDVEVRPEIERRVAEVVTQRKLMADRPDEPFAYRAKLRSQLTSQPRSAIQRISVESGEGKMHSEDKRRLQYFTALDAAQKQTPPSRESLSRLESFAWPYDPLISYFVHTEIAELAENQIERNVRYELNHRLYTVNFADSRDRSVTVVADAIKLIVAHPDAIPDAKQRWDIMNGLLQVMLHRWEARKKHRPTSAIRESTRIDGSLSALMASLNAMDQWRSDAAISEHTWETRRRWVEQTLVRPLRRYQTTLEPHQHRQELMKRMKEISEAANRTSTGDPATVPATTTQKGDSFEG